MTDAAELRFDADVLSFHHERTNASLIADCARLGYLQSDMTTLDATYGFGTFWRLWRPDDLTTNDLSPRSQSDHHHDFRAMPWPDRHFGAVVFDPPYKLNGTPSSDMDDRYGVGISTRWQDRMTLCVEGIDECTRLAQSVLLIKCMDQVVSGQVRWQSRIFADRAEAHGFVLVDMMLMRTGRPQPAGRRQVHSRRNYSTLLICERKWQPKVTAR